MPYTFDFRDGDVLAWTLTDTGATSQRISDYTPTIYATAEDAADLPSLQTELQELPQVATVARTKKRRGFREAPESLLRIDVTDLQAVREVASHITTRGRPGQYRCYNVDFSREFRYCLERDIDPTPARTPTTLELAIPESELASDESAVESARIDDEAIDGSPLTLLETIERRVQRVDPDVLIVNTARIVPTLAAIADRDDRAFSLGRKAGYQQRAGQSTYESYGQVGHSPARYKLPGRVLIDRSNTFLYQEANLEGCLDMVRRSGKPLQELAWASIGRVLTALQIQGARARDVLVPWHSWRHEFFKPMSTLCDADQGGFTFSPEVGLHEDVHELDFSSLYPNIMVTRNISPETICCACHADREDVPGLGYSICDEEGYLIDVLGPLIEDRGAIKAELQSESALAEEQRRELQGKADAIKWILVSCFGYQGFSNAKFGRIEAHEAINAFAREILLRAKDILETSGWRVIHGIVDSIWVTAREDEAQSPLEELAAQITDAVDIRLEYEGHFDWVAFCPRRDSESGALTKYFGRRSAPQESERQFKYRGIECRQHSTCEFVADAQRELIRVLDRTRDPETVCECLETFVAALDSGTVDPTHLQIENRVSKRVEEYRQNTRNVAALERAAHDGLEKHPGQTIAYVVVDDETRSIDRVALAHEDPETYDHAFYTDRLIRAAESVLTPLGWREKDIRQEISDQDTASLAGYGM